ncbi:MAG: hypothetical protein Ta2E_11890 [Mycoplasmoidaceae bacterium]|nr:MAG: hypothetical protein Ta2E_11890 [Mycoplasmoidaceae bacterium]
MSLVDRTLKRINQSTECQIFINNYQCDRQDGGNYFDGLFGKNNTIIVSGTPMIKGQNDTYFLLDFNNPTLHPSSTLICFVNDSLVVWDKNNGTIYRTEATELEAIVGQAQSWIQKRIRINMGLKW